MPEPREGETKEEYIPRCVSFVTRESGSRVTGDQAVGKCYGLWDYFKKKKKEK